MPDVRAQLIISARDEATATMQGVGQSSANLAKTTQDNSLKFTELNSVLELGKKALGAVEMAYDNTAGAAVDWGETVKKVAVVSGDTTEEASKMAIVMGDFGMQASGMTMAIKTMTKEGLQFNLDTLEKLAVKYQAIQDPVARDQFLFTTFGRSGTDLAMMLSEPIGKLQEMAAQADASGKVMSGPASDAAVAYGIKTHQLADEVDALKIKIGMGLIPALSSVGQAMLDNANLEDRLTQAKQLGIDTSKIVQYTYQDGLKIITNTKDANYELGLAIDAQTAAQKTSTQAASDSIPAWAQYADNLDYASKKGEAVATAHTKLALDAPKLVQAMSDEDLHVQSVLATWRLYSQELGNVDDALAATNDMQRVQAGMSDVIDKAQQSYLDTVKASQPEIDKLTQQIADMTAANGQEITTVVKGKVSQEDYTLATERAALANEKYQAALQGTIDKHGKFHAANALTLEGLRIAAEGAQNQVDKLSQKMGSSDTSIANYSTAIADAKGKLSDLQQKEQDAYNQVMATTGQFILQQLALDMKLSPAMELQMAKALGLVNEKEYNLAQTVLGATKLFDLNKNGMIDAGTEADSLAKYLADLQTQAATTSDKGIDPLTLHIAGAKDKLADMKQAAIDAQTALSNIHDKSVTITTNHVDTYTTRHYGSQDNNPNAGSTGPATGGSSGTTGRGYGAGNGQAAGGDYIVSSPTTFTAGEAGPERATFTPLGHGGGDPEIKALIRGLPQMMARAMRDAVQLSPR